MNNKFEEDVREFFNDHYECFTIYVVEKAFANGRGREYFKSFLGKENYINTDSDIKKAIEKILTWTQKHIPQIASIITNILLKNFNYAGIKEIVTDFSQLFSVEIHQAAGPYVIDPIIIQEGKVSKKSLSKLVSMQKESFLMPAIIIILQDNDFDRAKELLSKCPHGTNAKFIRNSGKSTNYKIINIGADDVEDFFDAFSSQCFSTCAETRRDILYNNELSENNIIKKYTPLMFQIRSNLLFDRKNVVRKDIDDLINSLHLEIHQNKENAQIILFLTCILKIFRVYCNDYGGEDIADSMNISNGIGNELLNAYVWKYAGFINDIKTQDKIELLSKAERIFINNNIKDQAAYCHNNILVNQFYTDTVNAWEFKELQKSASYDVPGLVGMSYLYNNTGVSLLYTGEPEEAIDYFERGLPYARERAVQKFGLETNILIAKDYLSKQIDETEIRVLIKRLFDSLGTEEVPFLTANYVANIMSIAAKSSVSLANDLLRQYPIELLFSKSLNPSMFGCCSLYHQIFMLKEQYSNLELKLKQQNSIKSLSNNRRTKFLKNNMCNPTIYNTWL